MTIKKNSYNDVVEEDEIAELILTDGQLDLSNFLYRSDGGFVSLPHLEQILNFIFGNERIISGLVRVSFPARHLHINFICHVLVGNHPPSENFANEKTSLKTITLDYNRIKTILERNETLREKIENNAEEGHIL